MIFVLMTLLLKIVLLGAENAETALNFRAVAAFKPLNPKP